jgi:hypothetical protein
MIEAMKSLKFRRDLVSLVLQGTKNATWRLFDDKDLSVGDHLELLVWETKEPFGRAIITKVVEKPFGTLTPADKAGHEMYETDVEMYKTYSGYYNQEVGPDTLIKLIWFELE